jgi:hypothetical protein
VNCCGRSGNVSYHTVVSSLKVGRQEMALFPQNNGRSAGLAAPSPVYGGGEAGFPKNPFLDLENQNHKTHPRGCTRDACLLEMHACKMYACEVHAYELHAREMHVYEAHARGIHACEVHTIEMHAYEVYVHEYTPMARLGICASPSK